MKNILKLEEAALFLFSIYLFTILDYSWWVYPALLLVPDIFMFGYIFNNKTGAFVYNFFHHKGTALLIYVAGAITTVPWLMLAGIILLGHTSIDRVFGYGLKKKDSFQNTHLGIIGR